MGKLYRHVVTWEGLYMLINCDYCGEEFHKKPSQIKRSKNHFCSKWCNDKWQTGRTRPERSNRVRHNCEQCNKEILVENYKYNRFLNGEIKNLFCDIQCYAEWQKVNLRGANNPAYNSIEKECRFCGDSYTIPKSEEKTSKYCSAECRISGRVEDIEVTCDYCDTVFTKKRAQIRNRNFCNRECSGKWTSENNNFQVSKECLICKKDFLVHRGREETAKTCSKECHYTWLREYHCKEEDVRKRLIKQGVNSQKNKKYSETKPERILKEFLIQKNIEFIPQHSMYDKFVVDFYLPKENIVIEVFGDYWHGNPLFYGDEENPKPLTKKQIKQKKKDKAREAYLKTCGHEFQVLWEHDIYHNLSEITKFLL